MSVYQCPKCELRFTWHTELDDHCSKDHPDFHHDYPTRSSQEARSREASAQPASPQQR